MVRCRTARVQLHEVEQPADAVGVSFGVFLHRRCGKLRGRDAEAIERLEQAEGVAALLFERLTELPDRRGGRHVVSMDARPRKAKKLVDRRGRSSCGRGSGWMDG